MEFFEMFFSLFLPLLIYSSLLLSVQYLLTSAWLRLSDIVVGIGILIFKFALAYILVSFVGIPLIYLFAIIFMHFVIMLGLTLFNMELGKFTVVRTHNFFIFLGLNFFFVLVLLFILSLAS